MSKVTFEKALGNQIYHNRRAYRAYVHKQNIWQAAFHQARHECRLSLRLEQEQDLNTFAMFEFNMLMASWIGRKSNNLC